jgi:hypothetical protein
MCIAFVSKSTWQCKQGEIDALNKFHFTKQYKP